MSTYCHYAILGVVLMVWSDVLTRLYTNVAVFSIKCGFVDWNKKDSRTTRRVCILKYLCFYITWQKKGKMTIMSAACWKTHRQICKYEILFAYSKNKRCNFMPNHHNITNMQINSTNYPSIILPRSSAVFLLFSHYHHHFRRRISFAQNQSLPPSSLFFFFSGPFFIPSSNSRKVPNLQPQILNTASWAWSFLVLFLEQQKLLDSGAVSSGTGDSGGGGGTGAMVVWVEKRTSEERWGWGDWRCTQWTRRSSTSSAPLRSRCNHPVLLCCSYSSRGWCPNRGLRKEEWSLSNARVFPQ